MLKKAKYLSTVALVCMLLALLPTTVRAEAAGTEGSTVVRVPDSEAWFVQATDSCHTLDTYWSDMVTETPATYTADDEAKTVAIGSAEALAWWAGQVNDGISFAGYTVSLTADIDLSAHYWTPICTGTVSHNEDGTFSTVGNQTLEGTAFQGNGHTITGLTVFRSGGDDAAFIGYNCCNLTLADLTFSGASITVGEPFDAATQTNGISAVVVGAQSGGSLTLQNVTVRNANVLAMLKASAFVGDLADDSVLTVNQCEISDSSFSASLMAAPIVSCGTEAQVNIKGIKLSGNTVHVLEQSDSTYTIDPDTGAQYRTGDLNASATAVFSDGNTATGTGHELNLTAEVNGYCYANLADAVQAVIDSESKNGTITLLQDATGCGIGLFTTNEAVGVNLTIDFGGHIYTCQDPAAGSTGTESQGFHLEKGNTVTLKNGTIAVDEASQNTQMLIQNYGSLILQDLNLQGAAATQYLISGNYGDMILNNVNADGTADNLVAIDLMHWLGTGYQDKAPTMVINNTENNTIRGNIDIYCYGTGADTCKSKPALTIYGGTYSADPREYLGKNLTAVSVDGLYRVQMYEPEISVTVPSIDSGKDEVQIGTVSEVKTQLADETQKIVDEILSSGTPAGVSTETAQKITEALQKQEPITVEIQFAKDGIPQEDKMSAQNILDSKDTLSQFFDLSVVLKSGDMELGNLTQSSAPLRFTISIPKSLVQANRSFFIVRVHDGVAEKLTAPFDANTNTLTFFTDKFSTYALGYIDTTVSGPEKDTASSDSNGPSGTTTTTSTVAQATPTPAPQPTATPAPAAASTGIPQTSDDSRPMLWVLLLCLSGAGAFTMIAYNVKEKFDR